MVNGGPVEDSLDLVYKLRNDQETEIPFGKGLPNVKPKKLQHNEESKSKIQIFAISY